jgi:hypothetical protein
MQIFANNIVFLEKCQMFHRKLAKIADNCDHNIDPWSRIVEKECTKKIQSSIFQFSKQNLLKIIGKGDQPVYLYPPYKQGCQMVYFQTKIPIWVNFGGP